MSTSNILAGAHKALDAANNFTHDVTKQAGNKANPFTPKPQAAKSDYSIPHEARKEGNFMGVDASSQSGSELKSATEQHEQNKKALEQ